MEKGTFHNRLKELDFIENENDSRHSFANPNLETSRANMAQASTISHLVRFANSGPASSSSFDTLLRQNEDLQAKLNVTLKRMHENEAQIHSAEDDILKLRTSHRALQDQLLIWKEKEHMWLTRLEVAEQAEARTAELEQQIKSLTSEVQRYSKYHEKVKVQVKPYIRQLKDYSQSLLEQTRELHRAVLNGEYELDRRASRIADLERELTSTQNHYDNAIRELNETHGNEHASMHAELLHLREQQSVLQAKADRLERVLERCDELENTTVALRRTNEELQNKHQIDNEGLRISLQMTRNDLTKKNLILDASEQKVQEQEAQLKKQAAEMANLNDQLSSLRYLWNEKSTANEKLQQQLQSLEKVNLELSQRLKELRPSQSLEL